MPKGEERITPWAAALESLAAFGTALALVAVLELGDKTQLLNLALATRHPWAQVLLGASLGLLAVTALGVLLGAALATAIGTYGRILNAGAGVVFLLLAVMAYRESDGDERLPPSRLPPAARSFALNFLAELGDKTQLAVIVLAATGSAPLSVFAGAGLALISVATGSVLLGRALPRQFPRRSLRLLSTMLFLAVGVILLAEAAFG